ncbi:hypothetical protein D3C71_1683340 [compost metagenome]
MIAQRAPPETLSRSARWAPSATGWSLRTVAVARTLRSGWTSVTASLTGPSPNTCMTKAPLNLMFDCISTPAAAISPSSACTGGA